MKFLGVYDYTVILTYMSLASAVYGITLASSGRFTAAVLCLMLSGLCDAFDGTVARSKPNRTEDEKSFGIQLDSLCDIISFGVFPALLCYHLGVTGVLGRILLCIFCICGVSRLAYFNVQESKRKPSEENGRKFFHGLPITSSSMMIPLAYCTRSFLSDGAFVNVLQAVLAGLAFFFILDFRVPKPDVKRLLPHRRALREKCRTQ